MNKIFSYFIYTKVKYFKIFKELIFVFIFGSFFFYSSIFYSQHISEPKNIQSPNASSLGHYGDVPVNLYTGTIDVSIPLYSMEERGIPLDISLSYDASGVRIGSIPGWVGQNWSLNAGGVITRITKGNTWDEQLFDSYYWGLMSRGFMYQSSNLNHSDWSTTSYLKELVNKSIGIPSETDDLGQDLEPDLFVFNFMGYTGKFFLSHSGTWVVHSDSNIKVIIDQQNYVNPLGLESMCSYWNGSPLPKVIGKITLIDDNGISYVFGDTQEAIEYNIPDFFNQHENAFPSNSWYITKVIDQLGNEIYNFEYERGDYIANFYRIASYLKFKKGDGGPLDGICSGYYDDENAKGLLVAGQLIIPSYLKKITSASGDNINFSSQNSSAMKYLADDDGLERTFYEVSQEIGSDFNEYYYRFWRLTHDNDCVKKSVSGQFSELMSMLKWRKLTSIQAPNKNIQFNYNDNLSNRRLKLLEVQVDDKSYSFEYDRFDQLPQPLSKAIDHWGYFKGSDYIVNSLDYTTHYNSRETDSDKVKIGSLKKITYPTRGWTEFEYEAHNYNYSINENRDLSSSTGIAGGLRVKSITKNDGSGTTSTNNYQYTSLINPGSSSTGILSVKSKYYWPDWETKTVNDVLFRKTTFNLNNLLPLANTSGSHIGYYKVHEILEDGSYTTYNYTSHHDEEYRDIPYVNTMNVDHSVFDSYTDKSLMRGKLKSKELYGNEGNLRHRTTFNYNHEETKKVRAFNYSGKRPCPEQGDQVFTGNAYEIYYSDFNMVTQKEESFLGGNILDKETSYNWLTTQTSSSAGDNFLKSKQVGTYLGNDGQESKTIMEEYYYPFDYTDPIYEDMESKRLFNTIETKVYENSNKISEQRVDYDYFTINSSQQIMPEITRESVGDAPLEEKLIFDSYDSYGNIQQYHKKDGLYTSLIYGYDGKYLVAKIEGPVQHNITTINNWATQLTSLTESVSTEEELINKLDELRDSFPNDMVTTYTHKRNVGVSSITDPRSRVEYYEYDINERLIRIVDAEGKTVKEFEYNFKETN